MFEKRSGKGFLWWSVIVLINLLILLSDLKGYSLSVQVNQWWAGILLTLWVIISAVIGLFVSFFIYAINILKSNTTDVSVKCGDVFGDSLFLLFQNGMFGAINLNSANPVLYDSGHTGSNKFFVLLNDQEILLEEGFIVDIKRGKRKGRLRKLRSYEKILSVNRNKNILAVNHFGDIGVRYFDANKAVCNFRAYSAKAAAFLNNAEDIILIHQEKKEKENEEYVSRFEIVNIATQKKLSRVIDQFHAVGLNFAIDSDDSMIAFANGTAIMIYSISDNKDVGFIDLGQQIYSVAFLHQSNLLAVSLPQELMVMNINNQDQFSISYKPKSITNLLYLSERKEILGLDKPRASVYRWKIEDVSNKKIEN